MGKKQEKVVLAITAKQVSRLEDSLKSLRIISGDIDATVYGGGDDSKLALGAFLGKMEMRIDQIAGEIDEIVDKITFKDMSQVDS